MAEQLDGIIIGGTEYAIGGSGGVSKLKGKTLSVLGDSISTYSGLPGVSNPYYPQSDVNHKSLTWWGQLCDNTGMIMCRVNAIGGATISNKNASFCNPMRYEALYSNGTSGSSPDIIVVLGGINDWNTNTELGSYEDDFTVATDTYIPSVRFLMKQMVLKYPTSKIFFCTPVRSWYYISTDYPPTKNGKSIQDFADATKKCGSLHGVAVIDLYNNLSINEGNMTAKLIDRLHPKKSGCTDMARFIQAELERLY